MIRTRFKTDTVTNEPTMIPVVVKTIRYDFLNNNSTFYKTKAYRHRDPTGYYDESFRLLVKNGQMISNSDDALKNHKETVEYMKKNIFTRRVVN